MKTHIIDIKYHPIKNSLRLLYKLEKLIRHTLSDNSGKL